MLALLALAATAFIVPSPAPHHALHHRASLRLEEEINIDTVKLAIFDDLFCKGGACVTEGDMGRALGYFQKALEVMPDNEQTKKMVTRQTALGIVAIDEDVTVDVTASSDDDAQ